MKLYSPVLRILSAVHRVAVLPNDSDITVPENGGIDVSVVARHLVAPTHLR